MNVPEHYKRSLSGKITAQRSLISATERCAPALRPPALRPPAHRSAPAQPIFGSLSSVFRSAHMLWAALQIQDRSPESRPVASRKFHRRSWRDRSRPVLDLQRAPGLCLNLW